MNVLLVGWLFSYFFVGSEKKQRFIIQVNYYPVWGIQVTFIFETIGPTFAPHKDLGAFAGEYKLRDNKYPIFTEKCADKIE